MEEQERSSEKNGANHDANRSQFGSASMDGKEQDEPNARQTHRNAYESEDEIERLAKEFWRWLMRQNIQVHQWIIALSSIALLGVTFSQLVVSCSGSAQMEKLISAADKNADAAEKFRVAAEGINQGIGDAVSKLNSQAVSAGKQADAATAMVDANQQMIESQRAAISVELYGVLNPVTFHDRGLSLAFSVLLINNGQVRAVDMVVRFKPSYIQWGPVEFAEPEKRQATLCNKPPTADETKQAKELATGDVIFAGAHKETEINFGMGAPTQEEIIKWPPDSAYKQNPALTVPQADRVHPIVVGCIDYGSGAVPGRHQAGFIFDIEKTGEDSSLPTFIKLGEDVARGNVVITKYLFSQGKNY